jgi:hypothetical protein
MLYDMHMVFLICLSQAKIDMADISLLYVPYASHTVYTIAAAHRRRRRRRRRRRLPLTARVSRRLDGVDGGGGYCRHCQRSARVLHAFLPPSDDDHPSLSGCPGCSSGVAPLLWGLSSPNMMIGWRTYFVTSDGQISNRIAVLNLKSICLQI